MINLFPENIDEANRRSTERWATSFDSGDQDAEGVLVHLARRPDENLEVLEQAARRAEEGTFVVILLPGRFTDYSSANRVWWLVRLLLTYGNVRWVEGLPKTEQLRELFQEQSARQDNILARQVLNLPEMQLDLLRAVRHDLYHALECPTEYSDEKTELDARWMKNAIMIFGDKDRDGLIAEVMRASLRKTTGSSNPFWGENFDVVCCDVEGTLLVRGEVNQSLLDELLEYEKPVLLWTGGDHEAIAADLWRRGITLPVIPKGVMRGASVAVAIDDLLENEFLDAYGVKVGSYRQVKLRA